MASLDNGSRDLPGFRLASFSSDGSGIHVHGIIVNFYRAIKKVGSMVRRICEGSSPNFFILKVTIETQNATNSRKIQLGMLWVYKYKIHSEATHIPLNGCPRLSVLFTHYKYMFLSNSIGKFYQVFVKMGDWLI